MSSPLLVARDGPVATLTLNRPESLNALDYTLMDALVEAAADVAADDALRVVVLRGAGRHFMAGGDLNTFAGELAKPPERRNADFQAMIARLHAAIETFHRMPHPLVGGVHGAVAGFGLSLMNVCDLVIAADDAYFASAYRAIGLTPDGGGSWSLPRIVGMRRAMEIMLLGERFDAQAALAWGLVNRVVPADLLDTAVGAVAQSLADGPVLALRSAKRLLRESSGRSLSEQLAAEATSFGACAGTADFAEGIRAFLEKRQARFGAEQ
ncbi:MAG: enoyl-CoA hydratase/isomerase family protein [Burkholderiales bacterium]|nr:enoyl-CoA hydratase/isomerase family protein [Burkholderiales bacterium]